MSKARLSNKIRNQIIENFFNEKIKPRVDKIIKDEKTFILSALKDDLVQPTKLYAKHRDLVELGYLNARSTISGNYGYLSSDKGNHLIQKLGEVISRHIVVNVPNYLTVNMGQTLSIDCFDRKQDVYRKVKLINQDIEKIQSIVYSCTTIAKLTELLPEINQHVPKPEKASGTELVPMETINRCKELLS